MNAKIWGMEFHGETVATIWQVREVDVRVYGVPCESSLQIVQQQHNNAMHLRGASDVELQSGCSPMLSIRTPLRSYETVNAID